MQILHVEKLQSESSSQKASECGSVCPSPYAPVCFNMRCRIAWVLAETLKQISANGGSQTSSPSNVMFCYGLFGSRCPPSNFRWASLSLALSLVAKRLKINKLGMWKSLTWTENSSFCGPDIEIQSPKLVVQTYPGLVLAPRGPPSEGSPRSEVPTGE